MSLPAGDNRKQEERNQGDPQALGTPIRLSLGAAAGQELGAEPCRAVSGCALGPVSPQPLGRSEGLVGLSIDSPDRGAFNRLVSLVHLPLIFPASPSNLNSVSDLRLLTGGVTLSHSSAEPRWRSPNLAP